MACAHQTAEANSVDNGVSTTSFFDETYVSVNELLLSPGDSERDVEALIRLIRAQPGMRILDCPCGYGRHAHYLRSSGYRVVGLDNSHAQVSSAQLLHGPGPYLLGDYRELPIRDESIDIIIALATPLGYATYDDDEIAMREFGRILKPGGCLLIETAQRDAVKGRFTRDWRRFPDDSFLLIEREFDYINGQTRANYYRILRDGRVTVRQRRNLLYSVSEWQRLIHRTGYSLHGCFGDLEGHAFAPEGRLVLELRRER